MPRPLAILDLGRMRYADALAVQQRLADERKRGEGIDTLLFVEHPHVVTMGRNAKQQHLLASEHILARTGIEFYESDRGGDVTYHGPGQLVGYPIIDLREWRRDVRAYFRGVEQCLIDALAEFGVAAERIPEPGYEGVWVSGAKIAAIGIHISRWVSSHGFALNMDTDLSYFRYIVPCGLTKPVCSLRSLGCAAKRDQVMRAIANSFARTFDYELARDSDVAAGRIERTGRLGPVVRDSSVERTGRLGPVVRDSSVERTGRLGPVVRDSNNFCRRSDD